MKWYIQCENQFGNSSKAKQNYHHIAKQFYFEMHMQKKLGTQTGTYTPVVIIALVIIAQLREQLKCTSIDDMSEAMKDDSDSQNCHSGRKTDFLL